MQQIKIELQISDGVQMATFHHYHLLSNHLKMQQLHHLQKMQHHFAQQQLQFMDHLQPARVQCRMFDNLREHALLFMRSKNELKNRNKKKKKKWHTQGQAFMSQETCGTLTSKALENTAARQAYLEKLQFEQNTLRSWSNMVQDQIMGEAAQASVPQPWAHGWAAGPSNLPPRPPQPTAQPSNVPVKPPPAPRPPTQQASSSSMSSAPVNAPFPAQMGANPWFQHKQNQQNQQ